VDDDGRGPVRTLRRAGGTAVGAVAAALALLAALVVLRPEGGPALTLVVCLSAAVVAGAVGLLVAGDPVDVPTPTAEVLRLRAEAAEALAERREQEVRAASAGAVELVAGLVTAEEGARGQLAAELHDTVAQSLALALSSARGLLARGPADAELVRLVDQVEDAEEQLRAVLSRTRPPALRDGDLGSAVAALRDDLRSRYALEVTVRWPAEPVPLPLVCAVTLYRFFQEALVNVVKHAGVDDAELVLEVRDDEVVATVRDAGSGFEPEQVRPDGGRHVGLGLLSERARLSDGRLEVESGGDRVGTLVRLRLPRPSVTALVPAQRARAAVLA
jgi:signal transduction histidine kinase